MLTMNKYIREILDSSDRAIIPGFGAILANKKNNTFFFNEYIKFNDGLLENLISKTESITIEEAASRISAYIDKIKETIITGSYEIEQVGVFALHSGKLKFTQFVENEIPAVTEFQEKPIESTPELPAIEPNPAESFQEPPAVEKEPAELAQEPVAVDPEPAESFQEPVAIESEPEMPVSEPAPLIAQPNEDVSVEKEVEKPSEENISTPVEKEIPEKLKEVENKPSKTIKKEEKKKVEKKEKHKDSKKKEKQSKEEKKQQQKNKEEEKERKKLEKKKLKEEKRALKKNNKKTKVESGEVALEKPKKKRKKFIVLWIFIFLAGAAVAGVFLFPEQFEELKKNIPFINENAGDEPKDEEVKNSTDTPGDSLIFSNMVMQTLAIKTEQVVVSEQITESDTIQQEQVEEQQLNTQQETEQLAVNENSGSEKSYHIILGCFEIKENVDKFLKELSEKGCEGQFFGKIGRFHAVSYKSFDSESEAQAEIGRMPKDCGANAWIFRK
ncbi:MAG: hypothetical protein A2W91_13840 [Bacteroidetes bacterium GWF2_38_335]|nr:MAG: hypothetical protein A2W91_13840 [Bacteroidetes bacterium GWF2_38_335]OFY77797.1 MAG: hypothetical protein A2281_15530 [Bacteroidetes bacterium RIFOXYA12_FULL_38_20]HBS87397.1 hypothetical protein [Bacteroidales bacterium]